MAITTRGRVAVALVSIGLISAACSVNHDKPAASGGPIPAAPTTTDPHEFSGTDFYATPPAVAGAQHGDLVSYAPIPLAAGGLTNAKAWRILYRSQAANADKPIVVSGFVLAPDAKATTPRPMVAWAHATVGSADKCAPSKTFTGVAPVADSLKVGATLLAQFQSFIDAGDVVVATDYEGLGTEGPHPYLVGVSEGRGVLDSIVAVKQFTDLNAGDNAIIYGLSQGGQAALFAGQLAASYTPGVKVAGVVAAAPFSEVDQLLPLAAAIPSVSQYYVLGIYGQAAGNASLHVADVLDSAGLAQSSTVESQCLDEITKTLQGVLTASGKTSFMAGSPTTFADWKAQLASIVPGKQATGAPIFIAQGLDDATVPAGTTQTLVNRICGLDRVAYKTYPKTGHGDSIVSADADIRSFVKDRLAGTAFVPAC